MNSEAKKHGVSDVFQNNLACRGFRIQITSDKLHEGILMVFLMYFLFLFESQSLFTTIIWDMIATSFSCETPAVFCGLKNFTGPSIGVRVHK